MRSIIALLLALAIAGPVSAEKIPIKSRFHDFLNTNVKGTSLAAPPYIQVIRSERGASHMLSRFKKIKNRGTQVRVKRLQKLINNVDFSKQMVVAVFSRPTDNYKMKLKKIVLEDDILKVYVNYSHKLKNYRRPPMKSIHYEMAVVDKMTNPALLEIKKITIKSKVKENKKVTVTGRLMEYTKSAFQLVPVNIKRGNKNSYYIRGDIVAELAPYLGRVITLSGTVSHERDSPYESELTVTKLVKAYE